jgi:putative LysE/RhtB family amino acid efflux pump
MHALLTGFGLGFVVAAAIGPISLLCMRTVLRGSTSAGVAIGAGAAVIDASYAALGSLGAGQLLEIDALRTTLGIAGCTVIAWFGLRALWAAFRVRLGGESDEEVASPRRAFLTSLAATASNPTTILSWAAVFAAVSTTGGASTALLVVGVGCGTLSWFTLLSLGFTLARDRIGHRVLPAIDAGAGIGLLGFAGVLGVRSVRDAA